VRSIVTSFAWGGGVVEGDGDEEEEDMKDNVLRVMGQGEMGFSGEEEGGKGFEEECDNK
jgi:hypothetical protein